MSPSASHPLRLAVVGAGWAGLAAAVQATAAGGRVTLFDMAARPGGRARSAPQDGLALDNGQHILIGAYRDTLALMRQVGVDPVHSFLRRPLTLATPSGGGLRLPPGPAVPAFLRGVLAWRELPWRARATLLLRAARWRLGGFRCPPDWTVERLCQGLPHEACEALIDPLCVAALNTPAQQASAQVLLTVLREALFGPPGSADLLLPTVPLQQLLPDPALRWLVGHGAGWRPAHRVQTLAPDGRGGWRVDGEPFDAVVLACSPVEAARLLAVHAPGWSATAAALGYQPIITVWLRHPGLRWPEPMMTLPSPPGAPDAPAQFGFDLGQLGLAPDTFGLVISGAAPWVAQGSEATVAAVRRQLAKAFAGSACPWDDRQVTPLAVRTEKRATFACTPGLARPPAFPLPGLAVAGDHVAGPFPATLEGAVRSGRAAVSGLLQMKSKGKTP